jgi:hypothetical protein
MKSSNRSLRSIGAALAMCALTLLPLVAAAQLTPGTTLQGYMNQGITSKNAYVGQTFSISGVHSPNHDINGATAYGHVTYVQKAGQGTSGKLKVAFDKIYTRSGNMYRIDATTTKIDVNTKSNATKEALAGAGGALVGGLLGGGIGAVIGGGGGFLYAKNNRQDVDIPDGSTVTFRVTAVR